MSGPVPSRSSLSRLLGSLILLGLFLTIRGYRSREGDQAYRLPILLHQQDAKLYADDPFVRSFDRFNPHRGYLALLDAAGHAVGLSAGLAGLFAASFLITCHGFDRLARSVSISPGSGVGLVAVALLLLAQAGNLGTNHLFEPLLLDRLIAFGLGWVALGLAVEGSWTTWGGSAIAVGLAALIHPSVGLQLAMLLGASRVVWSWVGSTGIRGLRAAFAALLVLGLAVLPGLALNLRESGRLLSGVAPETVRLLAAELQSPQHMLPHLWRLQQWLAWGCYPVLAVLSLAGSRGSNDARKRLAIVLGVNLAGLAVAWAGIEWLGNLRLILFQPFRMATVARGLCLVFVADHLARLWTGGGRLGRVRAVLIGVGLTGDWRLVVVTAFETVLRVTEAVSLASGKVWVSRAGRCLAGLILTLGLVYLSRHDTESGHRPLVAAGAIAWLFGHRVAAGPFPGTNRRMALRLAACWALPIAALAANVTPSEDATEGRSVRGWLIRHCRFAEVPVDDLERLAVWCRENTPADARFIGPPGPKSFRLWSLRSLAFNRAGSPYEARGLADWGQRFKEHVAFDGSFQDLVRLYQTDRHALERRYDHLTPVEKAELADRRGATHVLARAPGEATVSEAGAAALSVLHVEGRYAVYRVNRSGLLARRGAF